MQSIRWLLPWPPKTGSAHSARVIWTELSYAVPGTLRCQCLAERDGCVNPVFYFDVVVIKRGDFVVMYCVLICDTMVPVVARSKAWVSGRSPAEIWVRIQPGAWMDVCYEYCMLSGRGLCDELIIVHGFLPTGLRHSMWSRKLKHEEAMARVGPQRHGAGGNVDCY